jgi:hypothetical protein
MPSERNTEATSPDHHRHRHDNDTTPEEQEVRRGEARVLDSAAVCHGWRGWSWREESEVTKEGECVYALEDDK